ncbi:MAG: PAS domain-containing protein [Parvibaculaceae bacterium]
MQTSDTIQATAAPEEMLHPGSRALFRYWETIRGEMSAPPRDWLDLQKIRSLVPFLFMIERKPGTGYVWRLAGTRVCELWGVELTGKPALTQGERFERETVARLLDGVTDAHQPFVLRFRLNSSLGISVAAEFVGLPLRARNGVATYVFGVIMPFREISRPRHDQVTGFELSAARTIWTEPVPGAVGTPMKNSPQAFQIINGGRG